jgi:hypothetical protein
MKQTNKTAGTSFHGTTFNASVASLRKILGEPICEQNDGEDKVNFEWEMETEDGTVFTVYDWKEYRRLKENESIEWHVGGETGSDSQKALVEIREALYKL